MKLWPKHEGRRLGLFQLNTCQALISFFFSFVLMVMWVCQDAFFSYGEIGSKGYGNYRIWSEIWTHVIGMQFTKLGCFLVKWDKFNGYIVAHHFHKIDAYTKISNLNPFHRKNFCNILQHSNHTYNIIVLDANSMNFPEEYKPTTFIRFNTPLSHLTNNLQ